MTTDDWERVDMAKLRRMFETELAKARADAHRQVDELFDQQRVTQELHWDIMKREIEGTPTH